MPSYLVLARKYRPATFSEVVGQPHVVETLSNAIKGQRVGHAFLFCGVRGVGKTTVARILAKALNCSGRSPEDANPCNNCTSCTEINKGISVDVQEIDGASNTSVDNIREINENIKYQPIGSLYKIIIIDEVHMISINAFNALLKTLEEPPAHAKFIFATTESHKVPATINSRCQKFTFKTISVRDMVGGMSSILVKEGIEASEDALFLVAKEAQGSFRDALSLLDQVLSFGSGSINVDDVVSALGITGRESFGKMVKAILEHDAGQALEIAHELFDFGYDPEQMLLDLIHFIRNLVVAKIVPLRSRRDGLMEVSNSELNELEALASKATPAVLQNLLSMLIRSEQDIKRSANPWIAAEMTIIKLAMAPDLVDLSNIVSRINQVGVRSVPIVGKIPTRAVGQGSVNYVEPTTSEQDHTRSAEESTVGRHADIKKRPIDNGFLTGEAPENSGNTDEVWADLKRTIADSDSPDHLLLSVMEHGSLISVGPREVEIGFNKAFYREQFEDRLKSKEDIKRLFKDFFGEAQIKVLTLAQETSLKNPSPYSDRTNGQTDLDRALRHEAMDHPMTKTILEEFEDSTIEEIRML
jgi:DNA polymerase III subunit gamma/tau